MDSVLQDLRYAVRTLLKQRGFSFVAVLCLALGIGVNTVIFSVVNAILLRPFPYADPDALVSITEAPGREGPRAGGALSYPNYADYVAQTTSFTSVGSYAARTFTVLGASEAERVEGAFVSASMFPTLGIAAARGRGFETADDREGAPRVALISDALWERRYSRDAGVVGSAITVDGAPATVIGVLPPDVKFPGRADLWLPHARGIRPGDRGNHYLEAIGRLKPGVELARARAELEVIGRRLAERYPDENHDWVPRVVSLREAEVGESRPILLIMQVAVLFVLLIACANVANLVLSRGTSRHREIAIRTTLGAARARVVRQLLTENLLLALAGGTLGAVLAGWGLDLVVALIPDTLPNWMRFTIDGRVLAFTLLVSLATGFAFGMAPALQVSRPDLTEALKDGARGAGAARSGRRVRSALVVAEMALSLMLLVGASLMMVSFLRLQSVDPGFDYRNTLSMQVALNDSQYDSLVTRWNALDRIATEVSALPGVRGAAAVSLTPLTSANATTGFYLDGEPLTPGGAHPAEVRSVSTSYFDVMGIRLLRGRGFSPQELADSAPVTVINQTLAARHWPNADPIGKRIRWGITTDDPLFTVVGVVADVKQRKLGAPLQPQMYVPYTQYPYRTMTLMVSGDRDPGSLATAVRAKVREVAPAVPLYGLETMRDIYRRSVWQERLLGTLFTSFAVLALVLAAAGVYSVIAYSVNQRTHEIGVRMALGAQRVDVFRLVVRSGVHLALVGVAIGAVGALAATRVLSATLFGVSPTDPVVFGGTALVLLATALVASYLPARRAASLDPVRALKND
jgi:putative ABC transport system permease protein